MHIEKISVKALVSSILAIAGLFSIVLSVVSAVHFRNVALESQSQSLSRIIEVAAGEATKQLQALAVELGTDTQKSNAFRKAFTKLISSPSDSQIQSELHALLDDQFRQRIVTTGLLKLQKLRVYDLNLNPVTMGNEGTKGLTRSLPEFLYAQAKNREGADRLKALGGTWISPVGTMYSTLVPVGGLRLLGYLEVVVDPVHNLRDVANIIRAPLQVVAPDGTEVFKSENWDKSFEEDVLSLRYDLKGMSGNTALTLYALEDMRMLYSQMRFTQVVVVTVFTVLMITVLVISLSILKRYLFRPMNNLMHGMDLCAQGDLSIKVDRSGLKELNIVGSALAHLVSSLRGQVSDIRQNAEQVAATAEQLSTITQQTSQGMIEQQKETEQLAAAMNEMAATVQDVSHNAIQAAQEARVADEEADRGKTVVDNTVNVIDSLAGEVENAATVIHRLEQDSENIGAVLDVIKGIAEQTNLLALNAAIEAARAGDQGRGFAVVADEVRNLASRTQESTLEIQQMIEKLQTGAEEAVKVMEQGRNRAKSSVEQAAKAGASLMTITKAVSMINDMNNMIASSAEEQSAVAEEINRNVNRISEVTQQTTTGSEQTAQSSEELAKLAEQLKTMVDRFTV